MKTKPGKIISFLFLFLFTIALMVWLFSLKKPAVQIIEFEAYGSSMLVPVQIGGKSYNMIFDTGASTIVSPTIAAELGLETIDSVKTSDYYGNLSTKPVALLPEMTIGGMKFSDIKVDVMRPIQSFMICDVPVDGYIGLDIFSNMVIQFDLKAEQILVSNTVGKLLNRKKTKAFSFTNASKRTPRFPIFFSINNSNEHVIFDTGSSNYMYRLHNDVFEQMLDSGLITNQHIVDTINIESGDGRGLFGEQKDSIAYEVKFDSIDFLGIRLYNCKATTYTGPLGSVWGSPVLRLGKITVDNLNQHIYFEPYKNKKSFNLDPLLGFTLGKGKNKTWEVRQVIPGSVAAIKGIEKNYRYIKLNNLDLDSLSDCEMLTMNWQYEYTRDTVRCVFLNRDLDSIKVEFLKTEFVEDE